MYQNYEIPMLFLILKKKRQARRISQDAESPGQHSVVCTVNTQSVCNEACHYTNKHLLYLMNFFRSFSLRVRMSSYVCVYLFA